MASKPKPKSEPPAEEQRAARAAAWQARRAARGRGPDGTLRWEISGAGEQAGPSFEVTNATRAKGPEGDIVVRRVRN